MQEETIYLHFFIRNHGFRDVLSESNLIIHVGCMISKYFEETNTHMNILKKRTASSKIWRRKTNMKKKPLTGPTDVVECCKPHSCCVITALAARAWLVERAHM